MTKTQYSMDVTFDEETSCYKAHSPFFEDYEPSAKTLEDLELSLQKVIPHLIREQNMPIETSSKGYFHLKLYIGAEEKAVLMNIKTPAPFMTSTGRPTHKPQFPRRGL